MTQPPLGKKTNGYQRRENCRVENREYRQVTFSKRKLGSGRRPPRSWCSARPTSPLSCFPRPAKGSLSAVPSTDAVLGYTGFKDANVHAAVDDVECEDLETLCKETKDKGMEVAREAARVSAIEKKVVDVQTQAGKRFWWEADMDSLGEAEFPEFGRAPQGQRA